MDLDGSKLNNRDKLIQWSCNPSAPQQLWSFELQPNGNYLIRNKLSGKCIDIDGTKLENRDALMQWSCNTNASQHRWQLIPRN